MFRLHSIVSLITNSSSTTFSFSGAGLPESTINGMLSEMWVEWCKEKADLGDYSVSGWFDYMAKHADVELPYNVENLIWLGPPLRFSFDMGSNMYTWYTSMDNGELPEQFASYVSLRMSSLPRSSSKCDHCMANGLNTCPPCRY